MKTHIEVTSLWRQDNFSQPTSTERKIIARKILLPIAYYQFDQYNDNWFPEANCIAFMPSDRQSQYYLMESYEEIKAQILQ